MATNKLADNMLSEMQTYINSLPGTPAEKAAALVQQDMYRALFGATEDFINETVSIDSHYTVPENKGNMNIILVTNTFAFDPIIELPLLATNLGRKIFIVNDDDNNHRIEIIPKSGSSDTIEGDPFWWMGIKQQKNHIELVATQNTWIRKNREFVIVPQAQRPNTFVLLGGTALVWTDVSFLTWVREGAYALLLGYNVFHIGNGLYDVAVFDFRAKGETTDNLYKNTFVFNWWTNLPIGYTSAHASQVIVRCDSNATIQYRQRSAPPISGGGALDLQIHGYWK